VPQRAAVAGWAMQVAAPPPGVVRDGYESGCGCEMASAGEGSQVACADQQRGAEDGPKPGMDWMIIA